MKDPVFRLLLGTWLLILLNLIIDFKMIVIE